MPVDVVDPGALPKLSSNLWNQDVGHSGGCASVRPFHVYGCPFQLFVDLGQIQVDAEPAVLVHQCVLVSADLVGQVGCAGDSFDPWVATDVRHECPKEAQHVVDGGVTAVSLEQCMLGGVVVAEGGVLWSHEFVACYADKYLCPGLEEVDEGSACAELS